MRRSCVAKFMDMLCGYKGRVSGQTIHYEEAPLRPTLVGQASHDGLTGPRSVTTQQA